MGAGRDLSLHAVLPQSASGRRGGIQARDGRQRHGAHMFYGSLRCGDKPDQILFSLVLLCVLHCESYWCYKYSFLSLFHEVIKLSITRCTQA